MTTANGKKYKKAIPAQELKALAILARIYARYLDDSLDECRPKWHHLEGHSAEKDMRTELYTGRGGKCLLTLQECKDAYDYLTANGYGVQP